ncbi:hypothetical protein [Methylobacterium sp. WL6]|uniref:hypothetical protein n=1 Tax=Methylobacterium sp. WL6 TaxID=2603901 RepID=UPI0011CB009E|nr:hypothetical protein [Methylobacterium sp. WL6]TXN63555.1 hypothetical protein FV230_19890 [Methylobacterium sp. WL6]
MLLVRPKTGKTTLYHEVLSLRGEIPLIVRCDKNKNCDTIWKQALEAIGFERLELKTVNKNFKNSSELELGSKLNWAWLADINARIKGSLGLEKGETEARRRVLADPGPDLLVPLLKTTNCVLVIEDFHYLDDMQKIFLFQQWKQFIDNEVSVVVLGTTHRAVDIANSNKDLVGRISQIDVGHWESKDLERISELGLNHLSVKSAKDLRIFIASEAAGLPIIVQQACLSTLTTEGVEYSDQIRKMKLTLRKDAVERSLHSVARSRYTQFESYYSTLIRGPRETSRKYKTYELVLACFTLDPIKFSLSRKDIDHRMNKLRLPVEEFPPAASLNSTLGALSKFQERRDIEILEWRPREEIFYIIEPAFLFYVRWRTKKETQPEQLDMFEILLKSIWNLPDNRSDLRLSADQKIKN